VEGFGRHSATSRPQASRSVGSRLGEWSARLAGAFSNRAHVPSGQPWDQHAEDAVVLDETFYPDSVLPRFSVVKHGYDCDAVDEHVDELEAALIETQRELAELRSQIPTPSEITAEIERLGEQTSAILITAHQKATETVSLAEAQAQTCVADSASYAAALREEAQQERRRVELETESLRRERDGLITGIEHTAAALSSLAADAVTH
jgi:hypothetical protein